MDNWKIKVYVVMTIAVVLVIVVNSSSSGDGRGTSEPSNGDSGSNTILSQRDTYGNGSIDLADPADDHDSRPDGSGMDDDNDSIMDDDGNDDADDVDRGHDDKKRRR